MQSLVKPVLLSAISLAVLSGCRSLSPPLENPMLTDYQAPSWPGMDRAFGTTSLTASRRMVLFKLQNLDYQKICAEPPPSVGEQVSSVIQAAFEASAKKESETVASANAMSTLAHNLSTSLIKLDKPKGIQYEQDMLYSLCQLNMNNALSDAQVAQFYQMIMARSERILVHELDAKKAPSLDFMEGDVTVTTQRILGEKSPLELLLTHATPFSAYYSAKVVVREIPDGDLSRNTGDWKELGDAKPDGNNVISLPFQIGTTGINKDQATVLQAGIKIRKTQDGPDAIYPANSLSVFYGGESGNTTPILANDKLPLTADGTTLNLKLPKFHQHAYGNLVAVLGLTATSTLADGTKLTWVTKPITPATDDNTLEWNLRLPDEKALEKLNLARKAKSVPIDLTLTRSTPGLIPPLLPNTVAWAQYPAKPVSSVKCTFTDLGAVRVAWGKGSEEASELFGAASKYIIKYWQREKPTEPTATEYEAAKLQETVVDISKDAWLAAKSYVVRVIAVNDNGEANKGKEDSCEFDYPAAQQK